MSLVSLTFGNKRQPFSTELISISTPADRIRINPNEENTVKVIKVCQFVGHSEVYLVCEVTSGAICEHMIGKKDDKSFEILQLESKYPKCTAAKKGMQVGLTVSGIKKSDINSGDIISFVQFQ